MCFFILWYNIVTTKIYFVTVKIYVKLHHNSPVLICMDINRANKEIVDPVSYGLGQMKTHYKVNYFNIF